MSASSKPIYDHDYLCYAKGSYIGTATFTADPYIGDSFMILEVNRAGSIAEVALMPDMWIACIEE